MAAQDQHATLPFSKVGKSHFVSSSAAYLGRGSGGQQFKPGSPDTLQPFSSYFHSKVFPRPTETYISLQWDLSLPLGLLPWRRHGHASNSFLRRCPGGLLSRCPNHLGWLCSVWRTTSSRWMMSGLLRHYSLGPPWHLPPPPDPTHHQVAIGQLLFLPGCPEIRLHNWTQW